MAVRLAVGGGGGLATPHVTSGSLPAQWACVVGGSRGSRTSDFGLAAVVGGIKQVKQSGKETCGRMWGTQMEPCNVENDMDNGTVM